MVKTRIRKNVKASILVVALLVASAITISAIDNPDEIVLESHLVPAVGYDYQILWSEDWLDGDISYTQGMKVVTDSNNNVVTFVWSGYNDQWIVVKYDSDGDLLWEVPVNITGLGNVVSVNLESYVEEQSLPEEFESCTIETTQQILQLEEFEEQTEMTQVQFLSRGSESYTIETTQQILNLPPEYENCTNEWTRIDCDEETQFHVTSICTDEYDNIILVCQLVTQMANPQKIYVAVFKYDQNGNEIWKNKYDYRHMLFPGHDSVVGSEGNIFIPCNYYFWSYVLKLKSDGSVDWIKTISLIPFWYALSVALDSNENPVVAAIFPLINPESSTIPLGLTKFNGNTGAKITNGVLDISLSDTTFTDSALAIDITDNSVFFGFIDTFYKINPEFDTIAWQKYHTKYIYDLKISDEKLIACGGWCSVNDILHYYSAVYHKNSGDLLLHMALGELLYCDDPWFQGLLNHLFGISVDTQGDILFSGGEGGMRTVKVRITYSNMLDEYMMQYQIVT